MANINRRTVVSGAGLAVTCLAYPALARTTFRLGLSPVFLDNNAIVIEAIQEALEASLGVAIKLEQRRTYKEVTGLLLEGAVDAAWLCGYPYLQHSSQLALLAVPVWRGRVLYQSYLIAGADNPAASLKDLRGATHAFSDPDSNSGYLVTVSDLARNGETPDTFFRRSIYTFGHRNVVRAVADGLVASGSVDGYVWEVLAAQEPHLTKRTRVVSKSEWLGFPPVCARKDRHDTPLVQSFKTALFEFSETRLGSQVLQLLQLDGFTDADPSIYDGISARMKVIETLR
ncbi:MAG TPA: phosphonate ABC transporter substrate-binding protein [Maritimibacter sp.]|nr:phosphonate ABC transporter substrate-binding protein [Maritimibacter sp.]